MTSLTNEFGRVEEDGTVYVIAGDTERAVGQVPDATPEEALAFFVRRYDALETEVMLLESRVRAEAMSPQEAGKAIEHAKENIAQANAVGDLATLTKRLEALAQLLPEQIEKRKQAKAEQVAQTIAAKEAMVAEAEQLAAGDDWRHGADRFRQLLEEWKALPRTDRASDNELWHRFSSARTTYTRQRKAYYAQLGARRDEAKRLKEAIITEAEPLADSTDWGATSAAFRDLMARWKAAGSARRADDEALWQRFRAIQDKFFDARTAVNNATNAEHDANLAAKNELLAKVQADLAGVTDVSQAKEIHRRFLDEFNQLGHVPRDAMHDLDRRVRAVNEQVAELEQAEWRRTDPEARKRAQDTVALFEAQVAKLEQDLTAAEAAGDDRKAKDARKSLETYNSWLEQARLTLQEFTS